MAVNFLWDKESPNPARDVENPSVSIDTIASAMRNTDTSPPNASIKGIPLSTLQTVKLGLVIVALSVTVVLGVLVRKCPSSDDVVATQAASGNVIAQQGHFSESHDEMYSPDPNGKTTTPETAIESEPDALQSIKSEYYTSIGPLQARVKMVSPSIANGYETCSDLESDIAEALKLYMDEFIMNEAVISEMYASCDPENDNWYSDLYEVDYYYYGYQLNGEVNFTCAPGSNSTACATDSAEVPWAVTWNAMDHTEGGLFYNETEARVAYNNINSSWAKRLYDPSKTVVDEYGFMDGPEWCQLDTWAYEGQCNGKTPTPLKQKTLTKNVTKPLRKKKRSSVPNHLEKQTISRNPRIGAGTGDSYGQNSQHDSANEQDKVVSDGTYIYAAYGDVLYAWAAVESTRGVSITYLTEKFPENDCDWNSTEVCTSTTKPSIRAIFLGDSRLTVIVSQSSWDNPASANYIQPIITDYSTKVYVLIYDISEITLGSPLRVVGHKEFAGEYVDGRSIGNKTFVVTASFIDTSLITNDLERYQLQYCGLDSASYKQLAAETATKQVRLLAKQMAAELELETDCSRIFQVSMMQSSIDGSGLTGADILGRFVQVSTFDMSTDFSEESSVPFTVAGAFTAGIGYSIYLADDFLAFPGYVYKHNYMSGTEISITFILGFDLSTKDRATPYCYGHIPGALSNNYYMDKWDGHLRIASFESFVLDEVNWITGNTNKVYVLKLPSIQDGPGKMSLVGKTENLTDKNGSISGVRYIEGMAYISAYNSFDERSNPFIIVDLTDHKNPHVVGQLNTTGHFPYLQSIDSMNPSSILGVGYESDVTSDTWQLFVTLSLIDVSTPELPKMITAYREAGSSSEAVYDFLAVRYLSESKNLILPVSKSDYYSSSVYNYTDGFAVYDISENSITPLFNVTHSTAESYCWYDASIPPRSFVIQSELTTIKGHTVISTDMKNGSFISKLDLDVGFNYSFCDPWLIGSVYYYYGDEVGEASNNFTKLL